MRTAKYVFFISAGVASGLTPSTWYGFLGAAAHGIVACKERCNISNRLSTFLILILRMGYFVNEFS